MARFCISFSIPRRIAIATVASAAANLPAATTPLPRNRSPKNKNKMKQVAISPLLAVSGRKTQCRFRAVPPHVVARDLHTSAVVEEQMSTVASRMAILRGKLCREGIPEAYLIPGKSLKGICPKCGGGDSTEKSFSFTLREDGESAFWRCYRGKCGWSGSIKASDADTMPRATMPTLPSSAKIKKNRVITEDELRLEPLCHDIITYFNERGISTETLRRNVVLQRTVSKEVVIAFTYRKNGKLVNCKYRSVDKKFWQEKDTEKVLYGLDDIAGFSDIIIVEGEMDKLSMEEAGFCNCVSVPDGAPSKVSEKGLPREEEDIKFEYLWNCKEYLDKASRIILATDGDKPGEALAEELARRLGKERCWRTKWPKKFADDVCKDANEVLLVYGPDALREVVEKAELYPIRGLFNFSAYFHEIDAYYHHTRNFDLGLSTGWCAVDNYYKVVPGELTVVTGVPNSGKSEWIDALICNINEKYGWKFSICSMENKVRDHARKLLEKHVKKPFLNTWYSESVERMNIKELEQGKCWLDESFYLIRCDDDCLPNIKWVLDLAKAAVLRHGVRGLVIDPYNELDHQRPNNQTETEYVSQMLTKIKRFAQHHSCHVWFVAHPRQLHDWDGKPPNLYDISGSAHFINKCDNGIVIHRNRDEQKGPLDRVEVIVRKVRNKVIGGIGQAFLRYNKITGEFHDIGVDTRKL